MIKEEKEEEYQSPEANRRTAIQLERLQKSLMNSGVNNGQIVTQYSSHKVKPYNEEVPKAWAMEFQLDSQKVVEYNSNKNESSSNLADAFRLKMQNLENKFSKR